jgi:hypothetical protein
LQEFYSTSNYDQIDPITQPFSFDDYFNGESLVNQDVVAWASIGMQHIPHAEDWPSVTTAGNGAALILKPFNFFDEDPSMDLLNAFLIRPGADADAAPDITDYAAAAGNTAAACIADPAHITFGGQEQDV